jgi:putative transposase
MKLRAWPAWPANLAPGGHRKAATPFDQALEQAVESEPRKLEQSTSTWTCRELAAYLAQQGHVKVSDETVRRHLHALGYTVIRPVLSISSPDERYAEKLEKLRSHQAAAKGGEVVLLYEDEIELHLLPGIAGCWTKRGSQRKLPTPGKNQKRYGFGAVTRAAARSPA